ncbi:MAG TPA: threonine/serine exporter family protein [Anaeromyxobacter sp.]|nr:threonine/serine exporter family protein [Anaeromyxobacter sp.]
MSAPGTPTRRSAPPAEAEQQEITRLCVSTGVVLMQHGAESALIETLMRRLGIALGVDRVEAGIFANSIVLATLCGNRSVTTVRRVEDRGINMNAVTQVQRAVLDVEEGALDAAGYRARLAAAVPAHYARWMLALAIGVSCAAFARLARADLPGCAAVLAASAVAMYARLRLARLHFSPVVTFFFAAFVASSLAGLLASPVRLGAWLAWPGSATTSPVLASCVLFLVPGFPLINGVSDMVKGYTSIGLARLAYATLLAAAAAAGILLSMALRSRWGLP